MSSRLHGTRILMIIAVLAAALGAQPAAAGTLTLSVDRIESQEGRLMIAVLDSEAAFKGQQPATMSLLMPPRGERVSFSTDALPPGSYAVRVMHDENGNGEMDENLVGMPTEPWGFSNNAMGNFGPPSWDDVRFELSQDASVQINLNH